MAQLSRIIDLPQRGGENFAPYPFRPQWTPQAVSRFFGYMGTQTHKQEVYFSLQVGVAVVRLLELAGVLKGKVIDYGCGPGYLLDRLIEKDIELHGADFSAEAVQIVNRRLAVQPRWRGAALIRSLPSTDLPQGEFDLATCLETIEHLSDEYLESTLSELRRIVKPGGHVLLTTPNAEDLEKSMTYCPFCEAEYHAWQHVRQLHAAVLKGNP